MSISGELKSSNPVFCVSSVCDFNGLCALSIEEALAHLSVIAKTDPLFFIANYEKLPVLSGGQALPFLISLAVRVPSQFFQNFRKFPILSLDEVLTVLRAVSNKYSSYGKIPSAEFNLKSLLETVNESNPITNELTRKFLEGELKTTDDIPLIEHIIQYSAFFDAPTRADIEHIFRNVSKETQYHIFVALIKYRNDLFFTHLDYIFANLTATCVAELSGSIDKTEFFEALDCEEIKGHLEKDFPLIWTEFCEFQRTEQIELRKKDGALWTCIRRKKHAEGYLYTFRLKPEFINQDAVNEKNKEIYPAIEPSKISFVAHDLGYPYHPSIFLQALGYFLEDKKKSIEFSQDTTKFSQDTTFTIPDREALLYRYNQLRILSSTSEPLPELSITSSEGIASDKDFVQGLLQADGLISDGKEFIHDQMVHIIPLLKTAKNGSKFYEVIKKHKNSWVQSYVLKMNFIKKEVEKSNSLFLTEDESRELKRNLPILETLLGAMVDIMGSIEFTPLERVWDLRRVFFKEIIADPSWVYYLENRYNRESEIIPKFEIGIIIWLSELIDDLKIPPIS